MVTSVCKCDCRTDRQWKIDVFPTVRSQYQTHDDSQARSDLKVLWSISDVIWNRRRDRISTRFTGSAYFRSKRKHLVILDDLMDETDQFQFQFFINQCHTTYRVYIYSIFTIILIINRTKHIHNITQKKNIYKGGFTVYIKESPQKHQLHVHRSESVSP
jgi:hypothetical protein